MDEENLRSSLETYKLQLSQVEAALAAAGENADLSKLKTDLKELIGLTEESLISLMKSKLLSQLEGDPSKSSQNCPVSSTLSLTKEKSKSRSSHSENESTVKTALSNSDSSSDDDGAADHSLCGGQTSADSELEQIIGTKCRAAFSHDWGGMTYHNAMVVSLEPVTQSSEPKVRVLFTQPRHRSQVPCQFFLDNRCSYGETCKYSHGHVVEVKSLREYVEPDHGSLKLESRCLAKGQDRVWHPATVVEVCPDHTFQVMFDKSQAVETIDVCDVMPLGDSSGSDEESDGDVMDDVDSLHASDTDDDALPVYLWRPGQCNDVMADWEKHTKGIGSRLMMAMGYIMGQGLGKNQEGRTEPVPIQLLPPGKSLDKIMELKEMAGNRDLYDVMKKHKRKQKKIDDKAAKSYDEKNKLNVFDFINKKLGDKKGDVHGQFGTKGGGASSGKGKATKHISQSELKKKSDKSLNIQLFQTAEEIRSTEREIERLKVSLLRNKGEPLIAKKMNEQLSSLEKYLQQLKSSESSIQNQKQSRSDRKKLSVF